MQRIKPAKNKTIGFYQLLNTLNDSDLMTNKHAALHWMRTNAADENTKRIYLVCRYIQRQRNI